MCILFQTKTTANLQLSVAVGFKSVAVVRIVSVTSMKGLFDYAAAW